MDSKKCLGCGVDLQDENISLDGYTTSMQNDLCQRCFRLKNYGEYQVVSKSNKEYEKILMDVGKTKDLVLYVVDILNVSEDLERIRDFIPNKIVLVLNKRDVIPKSVKDGKLIDYFKNKYDFFDDILIISSEKNYNIDLLLKTVKYYQTSKNVYVVGNTNAGKSTLINKLIKNYSDNVQELTISPLPSTTLDTITIEINDYLTLIDTPGLVENSSLINYVDGDTLRKLNPKKEIKPRTYQIRKNQSLIINDLVRIDYVEGEKNSFTLYMSNNLKVKKIVSNRHNNLMDLNKKDYDVFFDQDLVISGLGFVKIVKKCKINIYIEKSIKTFLRSNLI